MEDRNEFPHRTPLLSVAMPDAGVAPCPCTRWAWVANPVPAPAPALAGPRERSIVRLLPDGLGLILQLGPVPSF